MKLPIFCFQCIENKTVPLSNSSFVEVRDDGLYNMICIHNHVSLIALQQQNFEILFDVGANAIIDGYYREAVSSFTASLERFYEFYIKVIALKNGVSEENFAESWKPVSRQSERQLGAFIYLYTIENKRSPIILGTKKVEFRNEVIHKGKIPEKIEAIRYGDDVLQLILPILEDLKTRYQKEVNKTVFQHVHRIKSGAPGGVKIGQFSTDTIISLANTETKNVSVSLTEILRELYNKRKAFENSIPVHDTRY